jgi:uracil-DNA glycosylase
MRDDAEICRRLEDIYASIDTCQHCSLGKLPINDGRHMRYKPGNVDGPRVVVVAQNPGKSKKVTTCGEDSICCSKQIRR